MPVLATSLDEPAATRVRELWERLEQGVGLKGVRTVPFPHLTWMGCEGLDTPRLLDGLAELAAEQHPIPGICASLGLFLRPLPVLHLSLVRSPALDGLHRRLWGLVEGCAQEMHALYHPDRWVPHVTLAQGDLARDRIPETVALLADLGLPVEVALKNVTLFHWIGPRFEPIERFPLHGR